ncbi:MAG TPA: hypothetical protein VK633_00685, partial [Verrucomicrobiae bacterium]|nr:hypothetical protein [Verrucomicrobiae bacterium]
PTTPPCMGPAHLAITQQTNKQIRVTWAPVCATLQQALSVTGPWTNITGAASPYVTTNAPATRFFRAFTP